MDDRPLLACIAQIACEHGSGPRAAEDARSVEVYVRMTPAEAAALDSLVAAVAAESPMGAGTPTRGTVLRGLVAKEVAARGLAKPPTSDVPVKRGAKRAT